MNEDIWGGYYVAERIPPFICPKCQSGVLGGMIDTLQKLEPAYSKHARGGDWEQNPSAQRFSYFLECNASYCGEVVAVSGDIEYFEDEDNITGFAYAEMLVPKSMIPGPVMFKVSAKLKSTTAKHLRKAFELYWQDEGACANRIRVTVESLLDDFGIPRTTVTKPRPPAPGAAAKPKRAERVGLNLSSRIDKFAKKRKVHKESLTALRVVGNHASHKGETSKEILLKAFSLLEDIISDLVDKRSAAQLSLSKKLTKADGRPDKFEV